MGYFLKRVYKINIFDTLSWFVIIFCCFVAALALHSEWLMIPLTIFKSVGFFGTIDINQETIDRILASLCLKDFTTFWISAMGFGFGIYFAFGFGFHWYYYVRQKDQAELWKCQPKRWLTRELELDEIKIGSISLFVSNTVSSLTACYIYNGGRSTTYFRWLEYGFIWWLVQIPVIFLYTDYAAYWVHRILHIPFFYNNIHKMHHKYKQPTAFSTTAFHPLEMIALQLALLLPLFTLPTHWAVYQMILLYNYYYGLVSHSGINFKGQWWQPWQPNAVFHDNHHQYYHVNFGFNCEIWDKLHSTVRKPEKIYNESIYYGKGKPITEISQEEMKNEITERETESRTAHDEGNPFIIRSE